LIDTMNWLAGFTPSPPVTGTPKMGIRVGRRTSSMEPFPTDPYLFQPQDQLKRRNERGRQKLVLVAK
jgi:hypothetical protein